MLVILSGASGVGKNTIINKLLEIYPEKMIFFRNATTRPMRKGEENSYYYLTNEEFEKKVENQELVEHQEVHGYYYGVLKSEIQRTIDNPDTMYIRDIEVYGNQKVRKYMEDKGLVLSIFIDAPDELLKERLMARGEDEERIKVRFSRAENERTFKGDYDYCLQNIDLDETVAKVKDCIEEFIKKNKAGK